jgi:succinoglycan biosynthesis protein ExoO
MDTTPAIAVLETPDFWVMPPLRAQQDIAVTVVIPSYNAADTLERAVRSVLRQSLASLEVLVVDDASGDESWRIIQALQREDGRVRALRNKSNQGKPVSMNRAIAQARGRWLAVLDADDWYEDRRLEFLLELGERHGADMVADNQFLHDALAGRMVGVAWAPAGRSWKLSLDDFLAGSDAFEIFSLGMLKPVLRTDFIQRTGLAYEPTARNGQDFLYLLQFYLLGGSLAVTDAPLYCYTQPFGAISRRWSRLDRRPYDFLTAYAINRRYLERALPVLTRTQARSLRRRNRRLLCLEHYYRIKIHLAEEDWIGALAAAIRHPGIARYLMRSLARRYLRRSGSFVVNRVAARARRQAP